MLARSRNEHGIAPERTRILPATGAQPVLVASVVGMASLVLYVATLAPDVVGGDAGEFQFVPYVLGIPHHTGYPLYTLLGKLWSLIPLGSVAFRMNLLSAVFAAATVAIVYLAAVEMTRKLAPALLASTSLAVTQLFWLWGTVAGVRSSTALMTALVLYLTIRWQIRSEAGADGPSARRAFLYLALAYGAALAHHRSAILLALPLALFVLTVNARMLLSASTMARSVLLFALPLATYLYLPIRSVGPLVKLVETPRTQAPAYLRPLDFVFGSQIALLGLVQYDDRGNIVEFTPSGAKVLAVTLYWKALTQPEMDYSVSVRLTDGSGRYVSQLDNKHPALSLYPTSRWTPAEVVGDYYELPLHGLAPGAYRMEVIMYGTTAQGWHNLEVLDASGRPVGQRAVVTQVSVP